MAQDYPDWTNNINFLSQAAAALSGSQYGAFQGNSLSNNGAGSSSSGVQVTDLTYTVPNNKTLYLWGVAAAIIGAGTFTNYNLEIDSGGGTFGIWAGQTGVWFINDQPFVFAAGTVLAFKSTWWGPAGSLQTIVTMWGLLQ